MIIAARYAEGFLEYAKERIGFDKALEDLKNVKDTFTANPSLKEFLANPAMTHIEKCDVINRVFHKGLSEEIRDFLKLLLKKDRISDIVEIGEYARLKYSHGDEVEALLVTTYPLETGLVKALKDKMEKKLKKKLHLYIEWDPTLLGGVRVVVGNTVFDGSVRRHLEDLREKLLGIQVA